MADLPMADRPEVVLPEDDPQIANALEEALFSEDERTAVAALVSGDPTFIAGWAHLSEVGRDPIERYAYARVGYHRGLDALRRNGWGGNGFVRWQHPSNRGFLHLPRAAARGRPRDRGAGGGRPHRAVPAGPRPGLGRRVGGQRLTA